MEDRLLRLEEKVDSLTNIVVRLDEQAKQTHVLLIQHDAKGAKALAKAEEVEDKLEKMETSFNAPIKLVILVGKICAALAAAFGIYKLVKGE